MEYESISEDNYNLDTPFINNYINVILIDIQRYQDWSGKRFDVGRQGFGASLNRTILALRRLLTDMPTKGLAFIDAQVSAIPELRKLNDLSELNSYEQTDMVFQIAMEWLRPNLLELHMNVGKPAYLIEGHLGNKPR